MSLSTECEQGEIAGFFKSNHSYQSNIVSVVIDLLDHGKSAVAILIDPTSQQVDLPVIATLYLHGGEMWWQCL